MATTGSIAVHVKDTVSFVLTGGTYGTAQKHEVREAYGMVRTSKSLAVRAGRFLPIYGIATDNHRLWHRSMLGFDEGSEQIGGEIVMENKILQGSIGYFTGGESSAYFSSSEYGYNENENQPTLVTLRTAVKLGRHFIGGIQGLRRQYRDSQTDTALGIFFNWSPFEKYGYMMFEVDHAVRNSRDASSYFDLVFMRIGSEPVRGFLSQAQVEARTDSTTGEVELRYGPGFRLAVSPHFSIGLDGQFSENGNALLLVSHGWL
jgi:hypothetical protein